MYLQNHGLLRSRNFPTMSRWHNNFFSPSTVLVQFIEVTELLTIIFCKCFFPIFTIRCQILLLNLSKHISSIAITKFNLCIPCILKHSHAKQWHCLKYLTSVWIIKEILHPHLWQMTNVRLKLTIFFLCVSCKFNLGQTYRYWAIYLFFE